MQSREVALIVGDEYSLFRRRERQLVCVRPSAAPGSRRIHGVCEGRDCPLQPMRQRILIEENAKQPSAPAG